MVEVYSIGELVKVDHQYEIHLVDNVKRGMKGLTEFDHLLVSIVTEEEYLKVITVKAEKIDEKKGEILVDSNVFSRYENIKLPVRVVDIKPYIPCEDTVTISTTATKSEPIIVNTRNEGAYEIETCGEIRKTRGVCYLKFQSLPENIGNVIRIVWWPHRFEDMKYRRTLLCNPPYESMERLGVFASRSPVRPNPIAYTITKVEKIDTENNIVFINDIDCYDHTPFLGVMNYDAFYDCHEEVKVATWAKDWPKKVMFGSGKMDVDEMVERLDSLVDLKPIATDSKEEEEDSFQQLDRPTHIIVRGARENNLKSIHVKIPYGKITAVVGVSGSGKSSLVKDTVYAECKRRMEYLSNDAVEYARPQMEDMTGCIPTVMINQKEIQTNINSTIGTFLGVYNHLRAMYASIGVRHYENEADVKFKITPSTFSYLDPEARCQNCNGTGKENLPDVTKIIREPNKSLLEGASPFFGKLKEFIANPNANWMKGQVIALAGQMNVDLSKSWKELPEEFKRIVLEGDPTREVTFSYDNKKNGRKGDICRKVEGIIPTIQRLSVENKGSSMVEKWISTVVCKKCHGERLASEGRLVTIAGVRYPVCAKMTFSMLWQWMDELEENLLQEEYMLVKEHVASIRSICKIAKQLGISYLSLDRLTSEISGGEAQRLKLLSAFQNHMTGILYIFDEPSKRLSPKEYRCISDLMKQLILEGNTVLMVEHNMELIQTADYVIEIGPEAGANGGYLVGEGSYQSVVSHKGTMLGKYMDKPYEKRKKRITGATFHVGPVTYHNLKNVNVDIKKQTLTCITGVSGSGKSSLMYGGILPQMEKSKEFDEVVMVESVMKGSSSRSIIATYTGVMDEIRALFSSTQAAKVQEYTETDFSFNRGNGRCEHCKGEGRIAIPYTMNAYKTCPICHGGRYNTKIQEVKVKDKSIVDVLSMSVKEAAIFFIDTNPDIVQKCELLQRVGLSYLKLGQSTKTLSGGEVARLKIACSLMNTRRKNSLFLLDEPTCGLHFSDIDHLITLLYELIDEGNTVVAIEHNKRFLEAADEQIICGPGAGEDGGRIIS